MQYRELEPSPKFSRLIKCFWTLEYSHPDRGEPEPVIPDGSIEIIFNLADRFERHHPDGSVETQDRSLIAGQMRSCVLIAPTGKVHLFGIRFHHAGAYPFMDFAPSELADRIEPLKSVFGATIGSLEERLYDERFSFQQQINVAERYLEARLKHQPMRTASVLDRAISVIAEHHGNIAVRTIAVKAGLSERSLERLFQRKVGITPKSYSRICRFQRLMHDVTDRPGGSLLDAALDLGYYDQAHVITDFHQFAGSTPAAFLARSQGITDVFVSRGEVSDFSNTRSRS